MSLALAGRFFTAKPPGKPLVSLQQYTNLVTSCIIQGSWGRVTGQDVAELEASVKEVVVEELSKANGTSLVAQMVSVYFASVVSNSL